MIADLSPDAVAVVTGGASGIGRAAARRFAAEGMRVCIVDRDIQVIDRALDDIAGEIGGRERLSGEVVDVSDYDGLRALEQRVVERWGHVDVLMNNAGVQPGSAIFGPREAWERVLAVNLWGVINGTQAFAPGMITRGRPGLIINTGSKQGITTPPGDPAYNISKAGIRAFTEALQHELRNTDGCRISAHLLIPGFVFTGLTAGNRTEKPAAAWTPEQTVDFMLDSLRRGDFYVLCPDNDVPRALDEKRILWNANDIVDNRPALSRWHPDYADRFKAFAENA